MHGSALANTIRVSPAEVERAIIERPALAGAAVIGTPSEEWDEVGRAILAFEEGARLTKSELRDALCGQQVGFTIARQSEIGRHPSPRTTSGEVQRFFLREQVAVPVHPGES